MVWVSLTETLRSILGCEVGLHACGKTARELTMSSKASLTAVTASTKTRGMSVV